MAVSANDVFRVAVRWSLPDLVTAYNILGLLCTAGSATDAELLTAIDAWLVTAYAYLQTNISTLADIEEARVSRMAYAAGEWSVSEILGTEYPIFTSTDSAQMLPHAVSLVTTFPTAVPTRKGKVFLPGFTEDATNKSDVNLGLLPVIGNFATALTTVLLPGTATVWYAILGDDGVARLPTAYRVNTLSGTQRRRKPGVGI